ncbi:response regulator, partial [Cronobacter sakazakii]
ALALGNEGYALDCAANAAEGDALLQSGEYSLIILDLGLPDKDGATLLSQWRRSGVTTPVLILTARDAL